MTAGGSLQQGGGATILRGAETLEANTVKPQRWLDRGWGEARLKGAGGKKVGRGCVCVHEMCVKTT